MGKRTILFIDDNATERDLFEAAYRHLYNVICVANRLDALKALERFRYRQGVVDDDNALALAIIDLRLDDYGRSPFQKEQREREGVNMVAYIRAQISGLTRIVMRTGHHHSTADVAIFVPILGTDGYWAKPDRPGTADEKKRIAEQIREFDKNLLTYNATLPRTLGSGSHHV